MLLQTILILASITLIHATCLEKLTVDGRPRCIVDCSYGGKVCECEVGYDCEFSLNIERLTTFTSYHILGGLTRRLGISGVNYYINGSGAEVPVGEGECSDYRDSSVVQCTEPNWVDGENYRSIIAVNGLVPGPTIIVDESATVIINVTNRLLSGGVSIHWHGLRQFNTPWMDGVGLVTQCNIGAFTSFQYKYIAAPSGSYWYHSHSGTQRADGLFGALIIRESADSINLAKSILATRFGVGNFVDTPGEHSLTLTDWYREEGDVVYHNDNSEIGFYPQIPLGNIPIPLSQAFEDTRTFDNSDISPVPFFSGLINGLGRHETVPYIQTRLSIFTVELGKLYRFRVIGSMGILPYRLSIAGHKLIIVATDGYFVEPVRDVDYLIIHSGERYDFILNATGPVDNYWIEANSMEINITGNAPYETLGHVAEGILHYSTGPGDNGVQSSNYSTIKESSPPLQCLAGTPCIAVNCPFQSFLPVYNINCVNADQLTLLVETPNAEVPSSDPTESNTHFLNFNFAGEAGSSTINGRNFIFPPAPPVVQRDLFNEQAQICDNSISCDPFNIDDCLCTHVLTLDYNQTVQLVVSSIQPGDHFLHPLHIHGHTFQLLKIGYPDYNSSTGFASGNAQDLTCENTPCTIVRFTTPQSFEITNKTVRKDTVMIPGGGYVVLRFISDNPGAWFLHCHIMNHELEGMTLIIDEAPDYQNPAPDGLAQCQNFLFSDAEFYDKLKFNPEGNGTESLHYTRWIFVVLIISVVISGIIWI
ncbi:L-ascorbate oxidase-like [Oopsacas minuta]|uniref:L-ascorbate oxidase-like n=1 Tax=Oopsacas minuta TaxID=111878 RepID=A0AAV7K7S4_9METZ|nr:L-ascorbate oxidase-like [Oopsacas minuta]